MAKKRSQQKKPNPKLKQLNFLEGKWHTEGEMLKTASNPSTPIKGMDTYEWINNGHFLLHRIDVFMGSQRAEAIEIIGYDDIRKSFFMKSFDNQGGSATMYATLEKPGVIKLGDKTMRSTLVNYKNRNYMLAKWERLKDNKTWIPWMEIKLSK